MGQRLGQTEVGDREQAGTALRRILRGHAQPSFGAMQRIERSFYVNAGIAAGQPLLRACLGFASAFDVNFRRTLGGLGENCHLVRQDFCKSPGHGKMLLGRILAERDLANGQFSDQGRVSRQDSQIPVLAGNLNFLRRRRLYNFLLRRDDLELESICHFL